MFSDHRRDLGICFSHGIFFFAPKRMAFYLDGQFLGIHLPIFFPLQRRAYPWQGRTSWNARHDPGCLESHSRDRDVNVQRQTLHNQLPRDILQCWGREKQKRMGFYLLFRLQNGICFVLHIDLALGLSVQIFWEDFFFSFSFLVAGPFAGTAPNAGNKRKCASNTNSSCWGETL